MKISTRIFIVGAAFCLLAQPIFAQEWSAVQKEVWKNVLTYSELFRSGKIEEFITYFHEDFCGWGVENPVPHSRKARVAVVRQAGSASRVLTQELHPLAIKVHGNIAIVHYYISALEDSSEGPTATKARWTDILMKQGNKWVMIADSGGNMP